MYKTNAIILGISRIRDNQTRIVMMSREYGKITGWWNKKNITGIDIGDIIEVLISRQESKNLIKNIDIRTSGWSRNWSYSRIIGFLETIYIVNKITLEGMETHTLYEDMSGFILYGRDRDLNTTQCALFQMRLLKTIGSMDRDTLGDDPILRYIYDNITSTPLDRILSGTNIRTEHISQIQRINLHSLYMLER